MGELWRKRLGNNVACNLDDILARCMDMMAIIEAAGKHADKMNDTTQLAALLKLSQKTARIMAAARDAREGKYKGG